MNIIEVKNLNFAYPSAKSTLKDINLNIEKGKFYLVIGENGSGKSTLIKCILGINKSYTGKITKTEKVAYLPQRIEIQKNFPASIEEVVLSATISNNPRKIFYQKEDREIANKIMKEMGIYDIKDKCFSDLSGGQEQRVLIARCLASNSKVIILDEPTNGLDPVITEKIINNLKEMQQKFGLTIIMISHDVVKLVDYADRVIKIDKGQLVYDISVAEYKEGAKK